MTMTSPALKIKAAVMPLKAGAYMCRILKKVLLFISMFGVVGGTGVLVNLYSMPVRAQEAKAKGYRPHLADLMNNAMQIHHTKLWFAGQANNWVLADYEVKKIKDTIEELKETIVEIQAASPQWRQVPLGEMLRRFDSNLVSLEQAVKAKDAVRFAESYRKLTMTCNACHVSSGQSQVKIIEPLTNGSGTFADQDFTSGAGRQ
jgi:hypothetical protein